MKEIVIIIPVYHPDEQLVKLVKNLKQKENRTIIVINDGSESIYDSYFEAIQEDCHLLKNSQNKGKGNALKKGFRYILENNTKGKGVITVDGDGQHQVEDIEKVIQEFNKGKTNVILGEREFKKSKVPLKSKLGNMLARRWIKIKTRTTLKDTQTGLRAIPIECLPDLVELKGEKYEYEMEMLYYFIAKQRKIINVPIKAIYDKKQKTYFQPVYDTVRIIKTCNRLKNEGGKRK